MTVLMTMETPFTVADVEAVGNAMGVHDTPPAGLISHVVVEQASGTRVYDVWEDLAAFQRFRDEQLNPSMQKYLAEHGMQGGAPPEPTITEAFDLVRGA